MSVDMRWKHTEHMEDTMDEDPAFCFTIYPSAKRISFPSFTLVWWFNRRFGQRRSTVSQIAFTIVRCAYFSTILTSLGAEMREETGLDWKESEVS
jgi:hypothetical protein